MRRKLDQLAADPEALHAWRAALAGQWAADDPETAATLFVDGHVKLYSGKANLPKHFVARQKLQLPAAAGYWLNALGGAPLLCIHKQVDPKMVAEIRHGIVPQLEALALALGENLNAFWIYGPSKGRHAAGPRTGGSL